MIWPGKSQNYGFPSYLDLRLRPFATILGMADHLSCYLGLSGYNACKLVPYGEFDELLPWMLRRLEENSDVVNAGQQEKYLLWKEVRRRLGLGFTIA